ncbi:MAG: coproporphyrinogen III oxidase [Alphaproteobacteria bacterium]|nr:coproporphyrinogen III oxidase [Alphaproteobacteria bacterium]
MSEGRQAGAERAVEPAPFAIYIHWPFCASKCPYCDFNSHVRSAVDHADWRRALLAELDHYALETKDRLVSSVFFGGGTPSLMEPATAAALLDRIAGHWPLAPDLEVTLEANPSSVEAGRFHAFGAAGVNRLSLGVQSLDPAALAFLGRRHGVEEALAAVALARRHFARFSFDLIYARPGQSLAAWGAELDHALALAGDHLSLYQLTIEAGTAFATAHRRGDFAMPEDELAGAFFELTQERLAAAGLPAYEISNHARPGGESRHNLVYWRYGDYLGIGPGAHGRLSVAGTKLATRQKRAPEAWLAAVAAQGHGTEERLDLAPGERLAEMLMMGLRLTEGVPRVRFRRECGAEPETVLETARLEPLIAGGFLVLDGRGLRATAAGRQRLNAVLAALL